MGDASLPLVQVPVWRTFDVVKTVLGGPQSLCPPDSCQVKLSSPFTRLGSPAPRNLERNLIIQGVAYFGIEAMKVFASRSMPELTQRFSALIGFCHLCPVYPISPCNQVQQRMS